MTPHGSPGSAGGGSTGPGRRWQGDEEPAACRRRAPAREASMIQQAVTMLVPEHPEAGEKPAEPAASGDEALVTGELLVEEISIDGMCGVC